MAQTHLLCSVRFPQSRSPNILLCRFPELLPNLWFYMSVCLCMQGWELFWGSLLFANLVSKSILRPVYCSFLRILTDSKRDTNIAEQAVDKGQWKVTKRESQEQSRPRVSSYGALNVNWLFHTSDTISNSVLTLKIRCLVSQICKRKAVIHRVF